MTSTKSFEKGQQLSQEFGFFEIPYLGRPPPSLIPYLGRGVAFYTCFSINAHFSCVTTGIQLFLGLSMLLAPQTSVPCMSFLWNWLLTLNHPLGHVWLAITIQVSPMMPWSLFSCGAGFKRRGKWLLRQTAGPDVYRICFSLLRVHLGVLFWHTVHVRDLRIVEYYLKAPGNSGLCQISSSSVTGPVRKAKNIILGDGYVKGGLTFNKVPS